MIAKKKVWVLVGTRPEAIKQIPLYTELKKVMGSEHVALVSTGQHKELLDQVFQHFQIFPDLDMKLMRQGQGLSLLAGSVLTEMANLFSGILRDQKPEWLVVQGDTTTAAMAAIAAYHEKIKVLHSEAGLRSHNLQHPFPEEANRKWISSIADLHMAPTEHARSVLIKENIDPNKIFVTGNTGIDALRWTLVNRPKPSYLKNGNYVFVTAHRRENEKAFQTYFSAIAKFAKAQPDLTFVVPIHPNNLARPAIEKYLEGNSNIQLKAPLDYCNTCHLLTHCRFVITDSGGIQEEAATLGLPTIVARLTTERSEAITAGIAKLLPPDSSEEGILNLFDWALGASSADYPKKAVNTLFGDGYASQKIVEVLHSVIRKAV